MPCPSLENICLNSEHFNYHFISPYSQLPKFTSLISLISRMPTPRNGLNNMNLEAPSNQDIPIPNLPPFKYIITDEHKEHLETSLDHSMSISQDMQIIHQDRLYSDTLPTPPATYVPISALSDYVPYMYLGGGGEGSAYVFQHRTQKNRACVVKIVVRIHAADRADPKYRPNEVLMLQLLKDLKLGNHPNIVDYGGYALNCPTVGRDSVFLGWCNGGDLFSFT
jgi:hypothetical protein